MENQKPEKKEKCLSSEAVIGISIAVVVTVALLVGVIGYFMVKKETPSNELFGQEVGQLLAT